MPADDDDDRGIDQEEDARSCTTVLGVQNTFTNALLLAAQPFEADKGATDEAERRVLWHFFAGSAGLPVVVLEDGVVVVGELQEVGGCPQRVLDQQTQ